MQHVLAKSEPKPEWHWSSHRTTQVSGQYWQLDHEPSETFWLRLCGLLRFQKYEKGVRMVGGKLYGTVLQLLWERLEETS